MKKIISGVRLTKEMLLKKTLGGWLYIILIFPDLIKLTNNKCKPVINHFRNEKKASLSFYKRNGKWFFRDFGRPHQYKGDIFDLYALVNGIDDVRANFPSILQGIYRDTFNEEPPELRKKIEEVTLPDGVSYEITKRDFSQLNKYEKLFLKEYNISIETMKKLDIYFLESYTFVSQGGKTFKINSNFKDIVIGHEFNSFVKIYKPNATEYKHFVIGDFDKEYFVSKKQFDNLIENKGDELIVFCAGMKDAMVLTELGFLAISLNSETANVSEYIISGIRSLEKELNDDTRVKIVYDNDETGVEQADLLYGSLFERGIYSDIITLPKKLSDKKGKDVSDWIKLGFPKDELIDLIKNGNTDTSDNIESAESPVSPYVVDDEDDEISYEEAMEEGLTYYSEKKIEPIIAINDSIEKPKTEVIHSPVNYEKYPLEIPEDVVKNFPPFLKKALKPFENKNQTMMTLAFLTAIGSILKNVKAKLRNEKFYANLYTIIVAPPASGKSLIKWARALIMPVQRYLVAKSNSDLAEYQDKVNQYQKDEISREEIGKKPPFRVHLIPADITSAMWLLQMAENDGYGLMYDTEIDGLIESNNGNLRSFTDYLRKAYENESLSSSRKTNNERLDVEEGKMSLLLSGTPRQYLKLLPSAENGLFSRIITYSFQGDNKWQSVLDSDEFDFESHFEDLGEDVFDMFEQLDQRESTSIFELSLSQLMIMDEEFEKRTERVSKIAGIDGRATVYRLGVITVKIAMILSSLRNIDGEFKDKFVCSDDDFNSALTITGIILEHVLNTLKMMNNERIDATFRGKRLDYFYALPDSFTFRESQEIAIQQNIKVKTAEKWIYAYRDNNFLLNPEKGQFKKIQ